MSDSNDPKYEEARHNFLADVENKLRDAPDYEALYASLLPCPFCGGEEHRSVDIGYRSHAIECRKCGATGPLGEGPRSAAFPAWNRREPSMIELVARSLIAGVKRAASFGALDNDVCRDAEIERHARRLEDLLPRR